MVALFTKVWKPFNCICSFCCKELGAVLPAAWPAAEITPVVAINFSRFPLTSSSSSSNPTGTISTKTRLTGTGEGGASVDVEWPSMSIAASGPSVAILRNRVVSRRFPPSCCFLLLASHFLLLASCFLLLASRKLSWNFGLVAWSGVIGLTQRKTCF